MATSNPIFSRNSDFGGKTSQSRLPDATPQQLDELYRSSPSTGREPAYGVAPQRMTVNDVVLRTFALFAIILATGAVGWIFPILMIPGAIGGLVLGLVNAFKKQPSPALIMAYAAFEGAFLGAFSGFMESRLPGIVGQAVIATFVVFGVVLALFSSGRVRATPKATRFFLIAIVSYGLFSLVNFGIMLFAPNTGGGAWGLRSSVEIFGIPLGILIGIFAVLLACYSLILDFTAIKVAADSGAPVREAWTGAFGLTVTLVWLYIELLRIFAIARE